MLSVIHQYCCERYNHKIIRMDINEDLEYSFEEQCFMLIDRLKQQLLEKESENFATCKKLQRHRLFRKNIFDEIDPRKKQYLDKVLAYTLKSLGHHLNNNLSEAARKRAPSAMTPTPVRDLSESPVSSRAQSVRSTTPIPCLRSRSVSNDSDLLDPVAEVIVVSSDEEISDIDEPRVKIEPTDHAADEPNNIAVNMTDINYSKQFYARFSSEEESIRFRTLIERKWPNNSFLIVNRRLMSNYIYDKNGVIHLKSKKYIKFSELSLARQPLFLHLVAKVIKLIQNDRYMSKRELYYLSLGFIKIKKKRPPTNSQSEPGTQILSQLGATDSQNNTQSQRNSQNSATRYCGTKLDSVIDDICCLVGCSRLHLRILSQSKGLVYGNLKFKLKNGEIYDCLDKNGGISLPTAQIPIVHVESDAKFILVLEKDSVLQKILSQESTLHFVRNYKVILFTAKGYPDVTSRAFLNYIWSKLKIPILALTDADPHGLEIVSSYKFGCYSTAYESVYLAIPQIKWLGLLPGDVKRINLSDSKTIQLSIHDIRKINSLLTRPYLKHRETWIRQLELMRSSGRKAELESLDSDGEYLVGTYLPNKLRYASWL